MSIEQAIASAFCHSIQTHPVPNGIAVGTGFRKSDGDGIGFYVVRDGEGYRIEDDGLTVPLIEAAGLALDKGTRGRAFHDLLAEYGVEYDEDEGELRTRRLSPDALPAAAMSFTALLLRMQDFSLLHPNAVQNTFREDALDAIEVAFAGKAAMTVDAPVTEGLALYPADVVLKAEGVPPLGIYLAASDKRILEAVVARMTARHVLHERCRIMALIDTPKLLTEIGLERAFNGLDGVAVFRNARPAAMGRIQDLLVIN